MAKKAAAKKGGGRKRDKVVIPVTPEGKVINLLRRCKSAQSQISELSGTMGEAIAKAVEENHLHRGAFGVIRKLDKMEPEKLRAFLLHFEHYLNVSGLQKRADDAPELPMADAEGEKDEAKGEAEGEKPPVEADDKKVVNLH